MFANTCFMFVFPFFFFWERERVSRLSSGKPQTCSHPLDCAELNQSVFNSHFICVTWVISGFANCGSRWAEDSRKPHISPRCVSLCSHMCVLICALYWDSFHFWQHSCRDTFCHVFWMLLDSGWWRWLPFVWGPFEFPHFCNDLYNNMQK